MIRTRRALTVTITGLAIAAISALLYLVAPQVHLPWAGLFGGGVLAFAIGLVNWIAARRKERDFYDE